LVAGPIPCVGLASAGEPAHRGGAGDERQQTEQQAAEGVGRRERRLAARNSATVL
jgi:hypothetical protein